MSAALEKLAETTVTEKSFDKVSKKTEELDEYCTLVQREIDKVKSDLAIVRRVGFFVLGILGAVTVAWLRGLLNI